MKFAPADVPPSMKDLVGLVLRSFWPGELDAQSTAKSVFHLRGIIFSSKCE